MTLDEFQTQTALKLEAAKFASSPLGITLMSVLQSEVYRMGRLGRTGGVASDDKIEALGQIQGFNEAIRVLRDCFSEPRPKPRDIPSEYKGPEPVETKVPLKPPRKREKT